MASKKDQAYQALQNYQSQAPGAYQSQYQNQIDNLMQQLKDRNFSYNYQNDPTYQQYKRQYESGARRASENAMANAAAVSGGYGSSWATTAGENAYADAMSGLDNVLNSLYSQALSSYTDESNDMYSQLQNLMTAESQAQQRYNQDVADYYNNLSYYQQQYQNEANREQQNTNTWMNIGGNILGGLISLIPYAIQYLPLLL